MRLQRSISCCMFHVTCKSDVRLPSATGRALLPAAFRCHIVSWTGWVLEYWNPRILVSSYLCGHLGHVRFRFRSALMNILLVISAYSFHSFLINTNVCSFLFLLLSLCLLLTTLPVITSAIAFCRFRVRTLHGESPDSTVHHPLSTVHCSPSTVPRPDAVDTEITSAASILLSSIA